LIQQNGLAIEATLRKCCCKIGRASIYAETPPVAEFFEELAYMTKRGVLDKGMVWNSFFWPIEHYYPALTSPPSLLEKARLDSHASTLYRELPWLYGELCLVCAREEGWSTYMLPNTEEVKQFLEDEIKLGSPPANAS
jgi:hypothetical protein